MGFFQRGRWRSESRGPSALPAVLQQRLLLFRVIIVALFAILSIQLFRLQVLEGSQFRTRAATNTIRVQVLNPERGLIYDRTGRPLVENVPNYAAAVVPADLPKSEQDRVFELLDRALNVRRSEIKLVVEQGRRSKDPFAPVVIKDQLDEETALVIKELTASIPGLQLLIQSIRHYSEPGLFSHIIGYMGPIEAAELEELSDRGYGYNDRLGKTGLELMYEDHLRGRPGRLRTENDASGRVVAFVDKVPPVDGNSLRLSIDSTLQAKVTEFLQDQVNSTGSSSGVALVMDVRTGEMLAMVSLPTYDNNVFAYHPPAKDVQALLDDPRKPLIDHSISEMFPPGSIFKQITAIAGLQDGKITPSTTYVSNAAIYVKNQYDETQIYTFKDWRPGIGAVDLYHAIAVSSDIYFYYVAGGHPDEGVVGVGEDTLAEYARMFGLGSETGIDLPGESAGLVPNSQWKRDTIRELWVLGDTYNFAIGQGYVATTPLQMLVATAAIANGGDVLRPHVVDEILDANGNAQVSYGRDVRNHVEADPRWFEVVRDGMVLATTDSVGTALPAAVQGVAVAGKTGTAEHGLPDAANQFRTHGWFAGFAPAYDPEIAVLVFVEHGGGHDDAAPVAGKILNYYFHEWKPAQERPADLTPTPTQGAGE